MKTLEYTPVKDYLLLLATPGKEKSDGGLFLPPSAIEKVNEGTIVALGPDVNLDPDHPSFSVGETVVFTKHIEWKLDIDGSIYYAVPANSILLKKIK